ncbi:hypothetical protein ADU59_19005 [Pararhizobium polonicum]|uniref:Uncharacterized protein n=1 Tax=Pararhizobium polonicum TaxID=1612624 RepID=A0A1C7P273_9HYPH|nr:hypothetical protein ADU59_19005 [Pararhizobium polonicum]
MVLPSGPAQPDREALPVHDRMHFGREPASGATERMISIPLFAVAARQKRASHWTQPNLLLL